MRRFHCIRPAPLAGGSTGRLYPLECCIITLENKQIGEEMRFAFGGIHIECSTYSRIRSRTEDFTVLRGEGLSSATDFAFLHAYPHPFHPTLYARAVPG